MLSSSILSFIAGIWHLIRSCDSVFAERNKTLDGDRIDSIRSSKFSTWAAFIFLKLILIYLAGTVGAE